jgi:hypothetical protein
MPLHPAVCTALYETIDEYRYKWKQKEADKPEYNGKKKDKEVIITTHVRS